MRNIRYTLFLLICSFVFMNVAHADAVCSYKYSVGEFKCTVSYRNGVSCTEPVNRSDSSHPLVKRMQSITLKTDDFIKNGKIVCPEALYADALLDNEDGNSVLKYYDLNTSGVCNEASKHYNSQAGTINEGGCTTLYRTKEQYSSDNDQGFNSKPDSESKPEAEGSGVNSGAFGGSSSKDPATGATGTETSKEFDPNSFCSKDATKNVFRAIGYIFFMAKIIIPLIIIALASIDFAKAVLASKDDEIKKTMKTLIMRVIAGVVIFFIPTILNFAIKLVPTGKNNPNNLYNKDTGTFKECTSCMLEPFSCK